MVTVSRKSMRGYATFNLMSNIETLLENENFNVVDSILSNIPYENA